MVSIVHLPRCYLEGHLFPFFDLQSIVQLDCAFSNRTMRAQFHALLQGARLTGNLDCKLRYSAVKWILNHQLILQNVCFDVHEENADWSKASQQLFQSTENIHATGHDNLERNEREVVKALAAHQCQTKTKHLKITGFVSEDIIKTILSKCLTLEKLELDSHRATTAVLASKYCFCNHLHDFSFGKNAYYDLQKSDLICFIQQHNQLQRLDLSAVMEFDEDSKTDGDKIELMLWQTIAVSCIHLQWFNIMNDSCNPDDDVLNKVLVGCPQLRHLAFNLGKITNIGIACIASYATLLDTLKIHVSPSRSKLAIITTEGIAQLSACVHLETLELVAMHVEDEAFQRILASCTKLRFVTFADCKLLSDSVFIALRVDCELQFLDVEGCCRLTDLGISTIVSRCRSLQEISIDGCVNLTDAAVAILRTIANLCIHCDQESSVDRGSSDHESSIDRGSSDHESSIDWGSSDQNEESIAIYNVDIDQT